MTEKLIGYVSHYYTRIGVAAIELTDTLKVGDTVRLRGATTDFEQKVTSMEEDHAAIEEAAKGHSVGVCVGERVRRRDRVYRVTGEE